MRNVERIGSDDMTLIQKRAFADLKRFGSWNIAQPDNMVDFRNWFGLIDDLFFGGLLKGFCRIEVVDEKEMISRTGKPRMGYSKIITPGSKSDPKHKLKAPYCLIVLRKLSKNPLDNIGSYISTLCHEMVHSMLQLYTCAFSRCRNEIERWGHGSRWQAPALAIEKAFASEAILGWKIKIGRETGMAHDIRDGEPMEGAEALQGLEIDFEKVKSTVKRLKKREENERLLGSTSHRSPTGEVLAE